MDFSAQEVAVRLPRFKIAWMMFLVAIAGINFAGIRPLLDDNGQADTVRVLLSLGALPVANVLVVGMLIARKRPGSRPFLLGFEVFGALALAPYIVAATFSRSGNGPLDRYLSLQLDPLRPVIQPYTFVSVATELFVAIFMLVGPQLVFALIGGLLSRRFKITITPR
jgi:hypothetical protein